MLCSLALLCFAAARPSVHGWGFGICPDLSCSGSSLGICAGGDSEEDTSDGGYIISDLCISLRPNVQCERSLLLLRSSAPPLLLHCATHCYSLCLPLYHPSQPRRSMTDHTNSSHKILHATGPRHPAAHHSSHLSPRRPPHIRARPPDSAHCRCWSEV